MTVKVGDKLPAGSLKVMGAEGPQEFTISDLFDGKKVVMLAVPGAFTPGCSMTHLPGFVVSADKIKANGIDSIICLSVNDAFVMGAWGTAQNADEIIMAADGSADYTKALGLEMDASGFGMGLRSKRYAMIVDDGVITYLGVDAKAIEASAAEAVLEQL
ncbi:antioxidant, AhpC/Tsa family protein [marine gamma proteobacterium HTCC2143]|jgi:peroxiredoxin|uniref:Glutathione-dependent peroxiredoxin n=1 Tax=marine gamma proteobacterium HTCC2143 TaxID=247633 RepID=A0Y9Y2_9GAMM|nr:antioxidant, AhpC/Tsa family protein [marine gamma proteobacterium HTCC2143]